MSKEKQLSSDFETYFFAEFVYEDFENVPGGYTLKRAFDEVIEFKNNPLREKKLKNFYDFMGDRLDKWGFLMQEGANVVGEKEDNTLADFMEELPIMGDSS